MQVLKIRELLVMLLLTGLTAAASAQQGLRMPNASEPSSTMRQPGTAASPAPVPQSRPGARSPAPAPASSAPAPAAPASAPANVSNNASGVGDSIVAVVNNDVITRRELDEQVQRARVSLAEQGIPAPAPGVLDRQLLDRMISERAQLQEAERAGIRVSDDQLESTIARIAEENGISVAEMRAQVEREIPWDVYLADLRDQIRINRLREMEVDRNIIVTEPEIDAFLAEQAAQSSQPGNQAATGMLQLAQILVRVPEGSSPSEVGALRAKAEQLQQQVRAGADFAQVAAAASDGEEALRGGDMGARPAAGWPDLFLRAVTRLQPGQVSDIVQSGNGFHILKVVAREGGGPIVAPLLDTSGAPMQVTQHRVRHILIRTSAVVDDERARTQLQMLRQRIVQGSDSFADMARQYSDDASAPQGGLLGWVSPGETVPLFEETVTSLQMGEVSQPVQTPFGWHLITVEDRRVEDVSEENRRMQARQLLFQRKLEPAWAEWTSLVRSRAYVDNRLEAATVRD